MIWLMLLSGPGDWRYIKAEGPCWKGEVRTSFHWFNVVLGWQSKAAELEAQG